MISPKALGAASSYRVRPPAAPRCDLGRRGFGGRVSTDIDARIVRVLIGQGTDEDRAILDADPVLWRTRLIVITGLVQATITELNPRIKRINSILNEQDRIAAMRRRAEVTKPPDHRQVEVYDFRARR
jgi:hypothetical protein